MRFHDPARPRLADGTPQYMDSQGKPIAALPGISIDFVSWPAWVTLRVMLKSQSGGYIWHYAEYPIEGVSQLLVDYMIDPEAVLTKYFGLVDPEPEPQKLTLGDLGL